MSFLLFTLAAAAAQVAGAQTLIVPDAGPARCDIWDSVSRTTQGLAPEQTEVRAILTDGIAEVELVQTFVNPLSFSVEAKYVFPLPHQGSVHGMRYRQDGNWRSAVIMPKATAQAIYDSVKSAGGSAALLTQSRPDIFSQSLARISPHDTVEVRIRLSMPLGYKDGRFEFAFPTMIGSRCCNESTPPLYGTIQGWNPPENVDGPRIRFLVGIQTGYAISAIESPTHPIRTMSAQTALDSLIAKGLLKSAFDLPLEYRNAVLLQPQNTFPNSDFVLRFDRASSVAKASSAVWPDSAGWKYFRLSAFPDSTWFAGERADVDVMVLFDRSGSQSGWPIQHQQSISKQIFSRLRSTDGLCVMGFDNTNDLAFADTLRPATSANTQIAAAYIDKQVANGGTELANAIKALTAIPNPSGRHRLYVFLTDGFITNEAEILTHLATIPDLQVITFGAGNNLNRSFLDEAAKIGNGFSVPLVQNDDIAARVTEAWNRLESPGLSGIHLDPKGLAVQDLLAVDGNTLYKGNAWSLLGRTNATGIVNVAVVGFRQGTVDSLRIPVSLDLTTTPTVGWAVPKLWARALIADLEREAYRGIDRKDSIVSVSIAHQVLSQYTAFLAWDGSATPTETGTTVARYSTSGKSISYSVVNAVADSSTVYSTLYTEIRNVPSDKIRRSDVKFRLTRNGSARTLELDPSLKGSAVRIVGLRGEVLWMSKSVDATSYELPKNLPAMLFVQVLTKNGWVGRALPSI